MGDINKFCERMRYWCEDGNLGYDQSNRWDIREGGECDCSSLVIFALREAGFDTGDATYTGNMSSNLTARGWQRVANDGNPQKGDILLNDANHVAVWLGGKLAQASIDENGNIAGGQSGEQANETNTRSYYNYPWDCYLRWAGGSAQEPGDPVNDAGLYYRAHCQSAGWLDPVRDGQVAGTVGKGLRMEALKVTPPEGWQLEVRLHIANVGWKTYKAERGVSDPVMGTTGKSQAVEDIAIRVLKRPKGDKRKLKFRVHQANVGWKAWTPEGYASGSDGLSIQLEAIQMVIA